MCSSSLLFWACYTNGERPTTESPTLVQDVFGVRLVPVGRGRVDILSVLVLAISPAKIIMVNIDLVHALGLLVGQLGLDLITFLLLGGTVFIVALGEWAAAGEAAWEALAREWEADARVGAWRVEWFGMTRILESSFSSSARLPGRWASVDP